MAIPNDGTAVVPYDSGLKRKGWVLEGLVQARAKSFWEGLTGNSTDAVIYQKNDFTVSEGHEIWFQFDGNLTSKAHLDKERAFGRSEQKKVFSDKLRVRRLRWSVDNGDTFDGVDIGNLNITQHQDSRRKLADLFIRAKDQMIFDTLQGLTHNQAPTHIIMPNKKKSVGNLTNNDRFSFDFLKEIERIAKTGKGYNVGGPRMPLRPFTLQDGQKVWLLIIDPNVTADLLKDDKFGQIMSLGDVRGMDNRMIKGVIGKVGSLLLIEAESAFGKVYSRELAQFEAEVSGLRLVDSDGKFEGEEGFGKSGSVIATRSLLLGRSAIQIGFGKMPDYKFQKSEDFGITSESALEVWLNVQKTKLKAENSDYEEAKVAGFDFGVVAIDTFVEKR